MIETKKNSFSILTIEFWSIVQLTFMKWKCYRIAKNNNADVFEQSIFPDIFKKNNTGVLFGIANTKLILNNFA